MSNGKKFALGCLGLIALFIVGSLLVFGYFFSDVVIEHYAPIEVKQLPQKNPTTYVFDRSLEQVRQKIISATEYPESSSNFPFKDATNDGFGDDYRPNANFYICEGKEEICLGSNDEEVEQIFNRPENKNDVYVASDGSRISSPVYHALGKPLQFRMDFHIHLEEKEKNKTTVTIFPVKPTAYKGYGGVSLHGSIMKKAIPVEPTTVEEYQLLRYIGFVLGEKDMPEVVLPKSE